ncbi:MAG: hypothetical protein K2G03_00205, partial [Bacilli bacterium]|nr:hypothetical protein [Bacilli bacterium]
MNEIVKSVLNRGAPIDTPVIINMNNLLEIFDNRELYDEYREAIKKIVGPISNILEFHAGETFLPVYATLTMTENNSKELRFSGENLYSSICEIFHPMNIKEFFDIFESYPKLKEFKDSLMAISTPDELRRRFPRLYEIYIDQLKTNEGLNTLTKIMNDPTKTTEKKLSYLKVSADYLNEFYPDINISREQEYAANFNLPNFLTRIMNVVLTALKNAEEIIDIYELSGVDIS